jgi:hypothetical protein
LPSTPKRFNDFRAPNNPARARICESLLNRPNGVGVVKNIVEGAVVGEKD